MLEQDGLAPLGDLHRRDAAMRRERVVDRLQVLGEVAVARRAIDELMEQPVVLEHHLRAVRHGRLDAHHLLERRDLGVGGIARGHGRHAAFEHLAGRVELVDRVIVDRGDDQAAPRDGGKKSLRLQPTQTFPRRRAADLQPLGNLVLGHAVAGLQLVADDRVADRPVRDVAEKHVGGVRLFHAGIVARPHVALQPGARQA
jgi:hypothetical protein